MKPKTVFFWSVMLFLSTFVALPVCGGTTDVTVMRIAEDNFTVLAQTTVNFQWMEVHLPVYGDGTTHYYHQGPVFNSSLIDKWNPGENDTAILSKDYNAVKGTDVKDLCDLVGGMEVDDHNLTLMASADGFSKAFAYSSVYTPPSRTGPIILTWYRADLGYVNQSYDTGMRNVMFADTSTNPWGYHVFGLWDMHEVYPSEFWYYYSPTQPSTTGLSVQNIDTVLIYSNDPVPPVADFSANPTSGEAPLAVQFTDSSTGSITAYSWDFTNDGTVDSTSKSPSWTYSNPGTYTVNHTVSGPAGSNSSVKTNLITVSLPPPPVVFFSANPTSGEAPLAVQFTDSSTGSITAYSWDFTNDGTVDSTSKSPSWTYSNPGTYTVNHTVSGPAGSNSSVKTNLITVSLPPPPVVFFSANPTSGEAPLAVQFTDSSTGSITAYSWDFTNDGTVDSTSKSPSWTYSNPGTYTVNHTVTGPGGSNSSVKADLITVSAIPAPVVVFSANPTSGEAPLTVQFTDSSTGSITAYSWDFTNDGTVDSTSKSPSWTYSNPGTYTVNHTVTGPGGSNSSVKADLITVSAIPAPVVVFSANPTSGEAPLAVQFTDSSTGSITAYSWDFTNDGTVDSTLKSPSWTYSNPGTYTVNHTVTGPGGSNSSLKADLITVSSVSAPIAGFSANPVSGEAPLVVQFTDSSTGSITAYSWDFTNDGTVDSTLKSPSWTYSNPGTYTVNHTVTGPGGSNSSLKADLITVSSVSAPIAGFSANPVSGEAPLVVQFTDSSTGSITAYSWDFTNDGTVDSTLKSPSWTYSNPGTYTVNHTVTGPGGSNSSLKADLITVSSVSAPIAGFSANPVSGEAPLAVQFTDSSTGSITAYSWDFTNDGTVDSTLKSPSWTYSNPGTYTVNHTVTGPGGSNSSVKADLITVHHNPPPVPLVAQFFVNRSSGPVGMAVHFTDTSTGSPDNWDWDFGDGSTISGVQNPDHRFVSSGTFIVTLTVWRSSLSNTTPVGTRIRVKASPGPFPTVTPFNPVVPVPTPISPSNGTPTPVNPDVPVPNPVNPPHVIPTPYKPPGQLTVNLVSGGEASSLFTSPVQTPNLSKYYSGRIRPVWINQTLLKQVRAMLVLKNTSRQVE